MSRVRIVVMDIEIEVESEDIEFSQLKKEAQKLFRFARGNIANTKPYDNETV